MTIEIFKPQTRKLNLIVVLMTCWLTSQVFAEETNKDTEIKQETVVPEAPKNLEPLKVSEGSPGEKHGIVVSNDQNKITNTTPQGTSTNNSEQQGIRGVNAGVIEPITPAKNSSPENKQTDNQQSKKEKKETKQANQSGVKEIAFADNEQINISLSNRDINRVLVKNDKIQSVNGPTGLYTAKNDAVGSAYISLSSDIPFTIFASTLKGHNFSLLVIPRSVPGRTVILEPTTPIFSANPTEEADSYQKTLVDLITNMINEEISEDYSYREAKKIEETKKTNLYGILEIKQIASYRGSKLLGIVSEVKNKTKKPMVLKPSYFYRPGVRAIALSQQTLDASAAGLLYQVVTEN